MFIKVNRLFVLSFKNDDGRTSHSKYYMLKIEIFNVLTDGKSYFKTPIKIKKKLRNYNYITGNLLDYEYFPKHYKLIATDLSKQIELENLNLRQISFIGRFDRDNAATMFFIIKKSEETTFELSQNAATIVSFSLTIHTI